MPLDLLRSEPLAGALFRQDIAAQQQSSVLRPILGEERQVGYPWGMVVETVGVNHPVLTRQLYPQGRR